MYHRSMEYLSRVVDKQLDRLLGGLPAVSIEGAKGVGKTATAARRAAHVLGVDLPRTRASVSADPEMILSLPTPLLIDEWHLVPSVWDVVRRAVDQDRSPGRYLLTGSALPPQEARIHSGAGRIVRLVMRPMGLSERRVADPTVSLGDLLAGGRPAVAGRSALRLADYTAEIVASGLPGVRGDEPSLRRDILAAYIDEMIERDIPELGVNVRRPGALRAWLAAYAAASATTTTYSKLLDAATPGEAEKPARNTADAYRSILERLWILEPLPAWTPVFNPLGRLGLAPKLHLVDPGLAARILGATEMSLLAGEGLTRREDNLLAALFESLAVLTVRVLAEAHGARVSHLRTHNGTHEIDIIVERDDHSVIALEVKLASETTRDAAKHLHWLESEIGNTLIDRVVLTTGEYAYRDSDGTAVVPLALLTL